MRFTSVFHFVAYSQALFFNEHEIAESILTAPGVEACKQLMGYLKDYRQDQWESQREKFVYIGFREKFLQHPALLGELLTTGERLIALANPRDSLWGIGLSEYDEAAEVISLWPGANRLGHILTMLRDSLLEGYDQGTLPRRAKWAIDELIRNPELLRKAS